MERIEQVREIVLQFSNDRLDAQVKGIGLNPKPYVDKIDALYISPEIPKPPKKIIDGRIARCTRYEEFNLHCYSCTLTDICDDPYREVIPVSVSQSTSQGVK